MADKPLAWNRTKPVPSASISLIEVTGDWTRSKRSPLLRAPSPSRSMKVIQPVSQDGALEQLGVLAVVSLLEQTVTCAFSLSASDRACRSAEAKPSAWANTARLVKNRSIEGTPIANRMPRTATATINSMSEKPLRAVRDTAPLSGPDAREQGRRCCIPASSPEHAALQRPARTNGNAAATSGIQADKRVEGPSHFCAYLVQFAAATTLALPGLLMQTTLVPSAVLSEAAAPGGEKRTVVLALSEMPVG